MWQLIEANFVQSLQHFTRFEKHSLLENILKHSLLNNFNVFKIGGNIKPRKIMLGAWRLQRIPVESGIRGIPPKLLVPIITLH